MDTDDYINNTDHRGRRRGESVRRKIAGPWENSGWGHGRDLSRAECAYAEHNSAEVPGAWYGGTGIRWGTENDSEGGW